MTVGRLESIKTELITILQGDTTLSHDGWYRSMFEVGTNTRKPCHSVDLDKETSGIEEYSGGMCKGYTINGYIITYLEPEQRKTSIGVRLDEYRERVRDRLYTAELTDLWTYIKGFTYNTSYPRPWTEQSPGGGVRLVAHRMITEFTITY